jgi:pimeloyl-ACP methyl ester carboxylesterase
VHLLGASIGGRAAVKYAARRPGRRHGRLDISVLAPLADARLGAGGRACAKSLSLGQIEVWEQASHTIN